MNKYISSFLISLSLKLLGFILILNFVIDFFLVTMPPKFSNPDWVLRWAGTFVDRGAIPLLGIVFLLLVYWIDDYNNVTNNTNKTINTITQKRKFSFLSLQIPIFILSTILSLFFLLLIPLSLNGIGMKSSDQLAEIDKKVSQTQTTLQKQYDEINKVASDPNGVKKLEQGIQQLDQIIQNGEVQGQKLNPNQKQELQQRKDTYQGILDLAKNPDELEKTLNDNQGKLKDQQIQQQNSIRLQGLKQGLRLGLNSLILTIGYGLIGWFGLRGLRKIPSKTSPVEKKLKKG